MSEIVGSHRTESAGDGSRYFRNTTQFMVEENRVIYEFEVGRSYGLV